MIRLVSTRPNCIRRIALVIASGVVPNWRPGALPGMGLPAVELEGLVGGDAKDIPAVPSPAQGSHQIDSFDRPAASTTSRGRRE